MYNKKLLSLLIFAFLLITEYASAQNKGFVQDEIIKVPGIISDDQINGLNVNQKQTVRTYYDGLSRVVQTVNIQASPLQNDLIQPVVYDNTGRQTKSYLPYAGKSTDAPGSFRTNAINTDQPAFYSNSSQHLIATDNSPYTQQVFENSPLQRLLQSGTVGDGFQPLAGQHFKTVNYRSNNASDGNILIWNPDGTYTAGNYYTANTLAVTDGKDEDNSETLTFADLSGHTVLKRQLLTTGSLDTYYVYNLAGMISYVIPPKAINLMTTNGNYALTQSGVNKLIFHYVYNTQGQAIERTVPGKGTTYIVYDPLNRPVLIQNASMVAGNKWNYIKYDALGRAVSQGIYTDATNTSRPLMQAYVSSASMVSNYNSVWSESRSADPSTGYYTNAVFPTANISPLAYSYYDDYDMNNDGTVDYSYTVQSLTNEAVPTNAPIKNAPTMVRARTVGNGLSNIWLLKVMFYDKNGNLIQTQSNNQLNYSAGVVTDYATTVPDFMGVVQQTKVVKVSGTTTAPVTTTVLTTISYDHVYRLNSVSQQYNGGATKQVAAYAYNELGQLVAKNLGFINSGTIPQTLNLNSVYTGTNTFIASGSIVLSPGFSVPSGSTFNASIGTNYLQTIDYRYNIRGQLLSINNSKLTNDGGITNADNNDLFGMQFLYDQTDSKLTNTASFNGKISAATWMSKDDNGSSSYERAFVYSYDRLDRYTGETYEERATAATGNFTVTHGWDETGITYDPNGNILTLVRNSSSQGAGTSTQIDNLQYTYNAVNPNQLQSVTDGTDASHTGAGFRNLTGSTGNYSYDSNSGNLTTDPYKGITTISYNDLNRTDRLTISGTQYIDYTYGADGRLIRKQAYKSGTTTQITDYIDGFVYNNTGGSEVLAYFPMPEGRVRNDGGILKQEYVITDQQGNARVSFQDNGSGIAVVRQENSYYGFGAIMTNSPVGTLADGNKQLYNGGSEWQNDYGNLPDYYQTYYRNYDASIGRFIAIDSKAESSEGMSVYHYAGNNPIMMNDPLGDVGKLKTLDPRADHYSGIPDGGYDYGSGGDYGTGSNGGDGGNGDDLSGGNTPVDIQFLSDLFHVANSGTIFSGNNLRQIYNVWNSLEPGDYFNLNYHNNGTLGVVTDAPYAGVVLPLVTVKSTGQLASAIQNEYNDYWGFNGQNHADNSANQKEEPIFGTNLTTLSALSTGNSDSFIGKYLLEAKYTRYSGVLDDKKKGIFNFNTTIRNGESDHDISIEKGKFYFAMGLTSRSIGYNGHSFNFDSSITNGITFGTSHIDENGNVSGQEVTINPYKIIPAIITVGYYTAPYWVPLLAL